MYLTILDERLTNIIRQSHQYIVTGGVSSSPLSKYLWITSFSARLTKDKDALRQALLTLFTEIRYVEEKGFTEEELKVAKLKWKLNLQSQLKYIGVDKIHSNAQVCRRGLY